MKKRKHFICAGKEADLRYHDIKGENSDSQFGTFYLQRTAFNLFSEDQIRCQQNFDRIQTRKTTIMVFQFTPGDCSFHKKEYKHIGYQKCFMSGSRVKADPKHPATRTSGTHGRLYAYGVTVWADLAPRLALAP